MEGETDTVDRIAGLHFPSQAAKVLAQDRFWTSAYLARYLGAASEFATRDPQQGRYVAQIGVQLAQLVPRGTRQRQQLIRALGLFAWTHQACGASAEADGHYRTALELASHVPVEPRIVGELLRRYASLLRQRAVPTGLGHGPPEQEAARAHAERSALQAADRAVELLQLPGDPDVDDAQDLAPRARHDPDWPLELARALIERARLRLALHRTGDAIDDLGVALEAIDPFHHEEEASSCLNLMSRVADTAETLDLLHSVARRVGSLRNPIETRRLHPGSSGARFAARVLRLDGRLFLRMGAMQRAERSLRHARRLLHGQADDSQLLAVSLDLARILASEQRQVELRRLSADTLEQVTGHGGLSLTRYRWRRAVASGRLGLTEIESIRQAFDEETSASDELVQQLSPGDSDHRPSAGLGHLSAALRLFEDRRLA